MSKERKKKMNSLKGAWVVSRRKMEIPKQSFFFLAKELFLFGKPKASQIDDDTKFICSKMSCEIYLKLMLRAKMLDAKWTNKNIYIRTH